MVRFFSFSPANSSRHILDAVIRKVESEVRVNGVARGNTLVVSRPNVSVEGPRLFAVSRTFTFTFTSHNLHEQSGLKHTAGKRGGVEPGLSPVGSRDIDH